MKKKLSGSVLRSSGNLLRLNKILLFFTRACLKNHFCDLHASYSDKIREKGVFTKGAGRGLCLPGYQCIPDGYSSAIYSASLAEGVFIQELRVAGRNSICLCHDRKVIRHQIRTAFHGNQRKKRKILRSMREGACKAPAFLPFRNNLRHLGSPAHSRTRK